MAATWVETDRQKLKQKLTLLNLWWFNHGIDISCLYVSQDEVFSKLEVETKYNIFIYSEYNLLGL